MPKGTARKHRPALICLMVIGASVGAGGCGDDPASPPNHRPAISSVIVFPSTIGPADSLIVTCIATDSDGDTLVYDWFTDSRLRIKGALAGAHTLYNTLGNSQVFYHGGLVSDSAWVQCHARDRRGMSDFRTVYVRLQE